MSDPWGETQDETPPWEINSQQDSQVAKREAEVTPEPEPEPEAPKKPATRARKAAPKKEAIVTVTESKENGDEGTRYEGISVTFKGNGGFNQPWIVVHAKDTATALATITDREFGELVKQTDKVGKWWNTLAGGPAASKAEGGKEERPGTPPKAADPEPGEHFCKHGAMEYNSGVKDNGDTWGGWFCQGKDDQGKFLSKDQKCKPQWQSKKK